MTFIKLTDKGGKPLLLKYELIESVTPCIRRVRYPDIGMSEIKECGTTIKLTNGNEYTMEKSVEEVLKMINGVEDTK